MSTAEGPGAAESSPPRHTVADTFRVYYSAGEIHIDLGRVRERGSGQGELSVDLANRVAMTPEAAKRLISSLIATLRLVPGQAGSNAATDRAGEKAAGILGLITGLRVPYRHEHSFRMTQGALLANRFLLSVDKPHLGADAGARVVEICARLGLPASLLSEIALHASAASSVHFGFEGSGSGALYKVYFEFPAAEAARVRQAASREPMLLHLAFKWDAVGDAPSVATRYFWYPSLSAPEIRERISQLYLDRGSRESCEIAVDVLDFAARRAPAEELQYLEVREDDNGRTSFDLNLYDAQLQVRDLHPLLSRMRQRYSIRPGQFQALYDRIKTKAAGHLAGGVHRDGKDFFNVYYGVETRRG